MNIIKRNGYHYLRHSFRKQNKVVTKEIYLGKEIPKGIEEIKKGFFNKFVKEELYAKLKRIQRNFRDEWAKFPDSVKKKMRIDFSIDFTYNTNAIEGSTVTHDETEDIIKNKISPHKPLRDVEETISHSNVFLNIINEPPKLTLNTVLDWHRKIFETTKPDIAGKIRNYLVRVGDYVAPDWQDLNKLSADFFNWYNSNEKISNPVEFAAAVQYKFLKIHPFGDGNGRIARLMSTAVLRKHHYPVLIIEYKNRKSYYNALAKPEDRFAMYFIRRYLKSFRKYVK